MKKNPKYLIAAAGVIASVAFYVFSGESPPEKTAGENLFAEQESEEENIEISREEGFTEQQKQEIRDIVNACLREEISTEIAKNVSDVLERQITNMAESGRLETALDNAAETTAGLVNMNTAGKEDLKTLSGIGDVKAENIIRYREQNGAFQSAEDLLKVDGISASLLEKIRPYITV